MHAFRRSLLSTSVAAAVSLSSMAAPVAAIDGGSPSAWSPAASAPELLALRSGIFDPRARSTAPAGFSGAKDGRYAIVQLEAGQDATELRKRIEAQGHVVVSFMPNAAYVVRLGPQGMQGLAADRSLRWAGSYAAEWKVDPALAAACSP